MIKVEPLYDENPKEYRLRCLAAILESSDRDLDLETVAKEYKRNFPKDKNGGLQTITRALKILEARGLANRYQDALDGRRILWTANAG